MADDLDYILQAISNDTRRRILRLLAQEPGLTYTKIMKRLGIEDSGTLGFHLKKMSRLLRKNEFGEYSLSDLGRRALEILDRLENGGRARADEETEPSEERLKIFSDKMSMEYTPRMARRLREQGRKAVFSDILKLVIYPMERELFNATVESIQDVLTVYIPNYLYEDVVEKCEDVFRIVRYDPGREDELRGEAVIVKVEDNFLDKIIGGIVSGISDLLGGVVSKSSAIATLPETSGRITRREKYLELSYDGRFNKVSIHVNDGGVLIEKGDPRIVGWRVSDVRPDVSYVVEKGEFSVYASNAYVIISLPERVYESFRIEINRGVLSSQGKIEARRMGLEIASSAVEIFPVIHGGELEIESENSYVRIDSRLMDSGNTVSINLRNGFLSLDAAAYKKGVEFDIDVRSGYVSVSLDGRNVPPKYRDGDDNVFNGEVISGFTRINVKRR